MQAVMERCYQCGAKAPRHPIVGITGIDTLATDPTKDVDILEIRDDNKFVLVPFCEKCWREPKFDGHFHFRQDAQIGFKMAGSENLGG